MIALLPLVSVIALGASPAPFFWPKPEVVEEIAVPAVIRADGVPVRMHVVRSKLGPQALLEKFANAFVAAGFYVAKVQKRHIAEPHVTGLDWRGLVSYTAILSPNEDGTTTCVLGEAALGKRTPAGAVPDFAPLLPGARDVMRIDQEAGRVITYVAPGAKPDVVRAFYRDVLTRAGWVASADDAQVYEKGATRISVLPQAPEGGATPVVLVQHP